MSDYLKTIIYKVGSCNAHFLPICPICKKFVKVDDEIFFDCFYQPIEQPNATCKKHGRIQIDFLGYF